MTLNLKSLAFVSYVSLFSVICIVVLATFGTFLRLIRRKEPHVDLPTAGKKDIVLMQPSRSALQLDSDLLWHREELQPNFDPLPHGVRRQRHLHRRPRERPGHAASLGTDGHDLRLGPGHQGKVSGRNKRGIYLLAQNGISMQ